MMRWLEKTPGRLTCHISCKGLHISLRGASRGEYAGIFPCKEYMRKGGCFFGHSKVLKKARQEDSRGGQKEPEGWW